MHPNTYLKSFWRLELRPEIFVAMSFLDQYRARYEEVIRPAIEGIQIGGVSLKPRRVDISKSGDSILTDISDGIAHSRLVLADVSCIGKDSITGQPYRNGNVMYEVGVALSCRQPSDVLLVRDDRDNFLFDVSTIPHVTLEFVNAVSARARLQEELIARLCEQTFVFDARIQIAKSSLSGEEISFLKQAKEYTDQTVWGQDVTGIANWYALATSRLLDKGLITVAGEFTSGKPAFRFTPLGLVLLAHVNETLPKFEDPPPGAESNA